MMRLSMRLAAVWLCCVLVWQSVARRTAAQEPGLPASPSPQVADAPIGSEPAVDAAAAAARATSEELAKARDELRQRARELEESFLADNPKWTALKEYLKWNRLVALFSEDAPTDADSLEVLEQILGRLRDDSQGEFQREPFTNLAMALERYRDLVSWADELASTPPGELLEDNDESAKRLRDVLALPATTLATETALTINKIIDSFQLQKIHLDLVAAALDRYSHPNVWIHISARMITRVPTDPVDTTQPVRDCILGTTIRGEAHTCGNATLGVCPAADHIALVASLVGQIDSRTTGYKKPVRIQSRSTTPFNAAKRAEISPAAFATLRAVAHADTHTTILSIVKVGKQFLHKLIVKIAWKRAREQKAQADAIASRHAEQAIEAQFDEQFDEKLATAREKYDQICQALKQLTIFPKALAFSSTATTARIAATFAKPYQLGAPGPPPAFSPANDVTIQIHESALNNAMPNILRNVTLSQRAEGAAPQLSGLVPTLIKDRLQKSWEVTSARESETPWSATLDVKSPATLHFDGQKLILRIRAAQIEVGDEEYDNWDIVGVYSATPDGARLLLRREGEVDAWPAGYDPENSPPLSAEQARVRQELERALNSRIVAGDLVPREIEIPLVTFPKLGMPQVNEIILGGGWLTLGWVAP